MTKKILNGEFEIIEEGIYKKSQSIVYREFFLMNLKGKGKFSFKIIIEKDSVSSQSLANIYILDGFEWKTVYSIPYPLMSTEFKIFYSTNEVVVKDEYEIVRQGFVNDIVRLKKRMKEVLQYD
jgi:hypothetical protein